MPGTRQNRLILSEITDKENIQISPEELKFACRFLKGIPRPANAGRAGKRKTRRDIESRLLTEKTLLTGSYASKARKTK